MPDDQRIPTSQPADRPSFTLHSDGTEVSKEVQVLSVVITRAVNKVATADLFLFDGDPASQDFPHSNAATFVPGAEIEITAGYHGDEVVIFSGIVVRHALKIRRDDSPILQVTCKDRAVTLTRGRKSAYFADVTDSDVIEEIAGAHGLTPDVEATSVTHEHLVQAHALDWDFVVTRAEANGLLVATDDGTLRVFKPDVRTSPILALSYGGNLLELDAALDARDPLDAIVAHAWGPADQALVEVEAADPGVATPGNLSASDLAQVLGSDPYLLKHGGILTDGELQAWADAFALKSQLAKVRGRARIQGYSDVRLGDLLELGGVGERFNGNAFVTGLRHEITLENWETDIQFGLDPAWFVPEHTDVVAPRAAGLLPGTTGLHVGLVTALEGDPQGEDRIQVRTPMIAPDADGVWARLASLDAGENRGFVFRPEIGDEVVLGFAYDDPRQPIVLGMLHSSAKPSPIPAKDDNHEKGLLTRGALKLHFDDDKKVIAVETPNGNKITLSDDEGGVLLEDEHGNTLTLNSDGITLESTADVIIKASGDVKIEGTNIEGAANAQFKAEGGAGAEVSSSATTVLKGSLVQIN